MLQSTIEKILPQLPELCDRFEIESYHRNASIIDTAGDIQVSVGEIPWGGNYTFTFNHKGELLSIHRAYWRTDGLGFRNETLSIGV